MKVAPASGFVSRWIDTAIASRTMPVLCAVFVFCAPLVLIWQVLPTVANLVARHVPVRWEVPLGEHVLHSPVLAIKESKLNEAFQASYKERVKKMADLAGVQDVRVEFRAGWPNAYALPGNIMLLTDDLFSLMGSGQEQLVDAIVAHELGHMKHRHVARMLVSQQLLTEVVLKLNQQNSQTTQVAGLANGLFLQPNFSRNNETEADEFAFNLLRQNGQSPKYFVVAMRKLQFWQSKNKLHEGTFTSSHPLTANRVQAAYGALDTSNVVDAYCKEIKAELKCTIEEFDGAQAIVSHSSVK